VGEGRKKKKHDRAPLGRKLRWSAEPEMRERGKGAEGTTACADYQQVQVKKNKKEWELPKERKKQ